MLRSRTYPAASRFFAPAEDEDVKIFAGSGSCNAFAEDDGAAEFVRERDNGNLDKARQLGCALAGQLGRLWRPGDSGLRLDQKKVLFAYAVARVAEQQCAGSVLRQAVVGEFQREVCARRPRDGSIIQDSAAFTKYLLAERSGTEALGQVFAELCGARGSTRLQGRGAALYRRYAGICTGLFAKKSFQ